jgi:RNA polymerase sigma-70 factor (sigma-E family)
VIGATIGGVARVLMVMPPAPVTAHPGEFDAFVRARTVPLLRAAYHLTGDAHLAEDLVQAALARTHRAWPGLHEPAAADAYTRKIMYHLQVSSWRRRRVAETLTADLPAYLPSGTDLAESTALALTLRSALLRLPPRQRTVLVLRFFDDLTEAQVASVLGVAVGTVKSQTAKALATLRRIAPELRNLHSYEPDVVTAVAEPARRRSRRAAVLSSAAMIVLAAVLAAVAALLAGRADRPAPTTPPSMTAAPSVTPAAVDPATVQPSGSR